MSEDYEDSPPADTSDAEGPSRSQRKRDHKALQGLVRELVALPESALCELPIEEAARDQLVAAKRLVPKALNREVRFLARQLVDVDIIALRQILDARARPHLAQVRAFQQVERWRDRLIGGDETVFEELIQRFPDIDRQQLRQLARGARVEAERGASPRSARKLFKLLAALASD